DLVGTAHERIAGLHFEGDVELEGAFRLSWVGAPVDGHASAPPAIEVLPPPPPFNEGDLQTCREHCPGEGRACSSDLKRAEAHLIASTQLYETFSTAAGLPSGSPWIFAEAEACRDGRCINELYLRCAQAL